MDRIKRYPENNFEEERNEVTKIIEDQSPVNEETMEPKTKKGIIANSSLVNVRNRPSMNGERITTLDRGTQVQIVEKVGKFYKIKFGDQKYGFVHSNFCVCQEE